MSKVTFILWLLLDFSLPCGTSSWQTCLRAFCPGQHSLAFASFKLQDVVSLVEMFIEQRAFVVELTAPMIKLVYKQRFTAQQCAQHEIGVIKVEAITLTRIGGTEVLEFGPVSILPPGHGEIRLRHTAIGLNFIDTYHRSGLYPVPLPSVLGLEAAGVIEAIGPGVGLAVGTRVGYCWGPIGAYASHRIIAADRVVALPDGISDEVAAAALLKGCTAEFLVERCARVQSGQWVLVQAAAGGVGLLLVQWLKHIGATVVAVAGSREKVALAVAHGADHGIVLDSTLAQQVSALTNRRGVDVVLDGVGAATFEASLDCLVKRGLFVSFGNASGAIGMVDFSILVRKGSVFATRPTLLDYYSTRAEIETHAGRVLDLIGTGAIKVNIDQRYALRDAATAHHDLEARRTTGSTILIP